MLLSNPSSNLLSSFSTSMSKERDDAIKARKQSGLDEIWQKAREQYQGIDEVNRKRSYSQSHNLNDPITTTMGQVGREKRSTVFVNITRPYTNAGVAHPTDVVLPTEGKLNWGLRNTPVSEIALLTSFILEHPEVMAALPEELQARLQLTEEEREGAIQEAKLIIKDWLIESKWNSHTRKQVAEAGKVGSGVIKGPFPKKRKLSPEVEGIILNIPLSIPDPGLAQMLQEQLKSRILYQPVVECIPVENCYPDMPSCGDDIQNGRFFWEEIPNVSKTELHELAGDETYFPNQIAQCLDEDPKPCNAKGESTDKKKKSYTRWRRTGELDLSQLDKEQFEGTAPIWAEVEIINDRVVKVNKSPLDSKKFPYRILNWEPRQDSWAGIGIPEQIETPQRGLNASVRAGNDNLGWSVGFQVVLGKGLEAVQGSNDEIEQYKMWRDVTDALTSLTGKERKATDAIGTIEFPNHLGEILPWINFWLQMAESTTGLSLLMQGQKATDSVGVSQMMMNSATTNLRLFIKHWDDDVCAPIVQAMYDWVQQYGPESARGDAVAQALGSSVLIVRDLQQQALIQLLDRFVQPVYGKSPKKGMDLFLESLQFDPRQLDLDPEEEQQLQEAAAEPDPKVQVEQISSDTDKQIAQLRDETERLKLMLDAQMKGLSLEQAEEAVNTQMAGNLALESLKQDGKAEEAKVKEGATPAVPAPEAEPSLGESMQILGLGQ